MIKAEARMLAKQKVSCLSDAEKEWASGAITDAVTSLDHFKKAKSVFIFLSDDSEPDTHELVGLALALEKTVAVPKLRGGEMQAVVITPFTNFSKNKWGIEEPEKGQHLFACDLAIVPMVAYDGLKRLGHGKGYYDRFLAAYPCTKIGIVFDALKADGLQVEPHDVAMDIVITEKQIITSQNIAVGNEYGGAI